jgi:hypothetical protein
VVGVEQVHHHVLAIAAALAVVDVGVVHPQVAVVVALAVLALLLIGFLAATHLMEHQVELAHKVVLAVMELMLTLLLQEVVVLE